MAKQLYEVDGIDINDSWYIRHDGKYYAYYLQYPSDAPREGCWDEQSIGVSVSDDLLNWEYRGTALQRDASCWCDKGLATGSVVEKDGLAYLLYTGNGWHGKDGLGLAISQDFIHFERFGNKPVVPREKPYLFPYRGGFLKCRILADPYVYPEPVDDHYYVFINCYAIDRPLGSRGCIAVMRSRDLVNYEPCDVALLSDTFDRLETPQIWYQSGRWMMYYGGVKSREEDGDILDYDKQNRICFSKKLTSGYTEESGDVLAMPDDIPYYIGKAVDISRDDATFIVNVYPKGGYGPYRLYLQDDKITITE